MSDATYPKASKASKATKVSTTPGTPQASARPADDYEYEDAEYEEPYDEDEELEYEYDEEEEGPGLLASPGRAVLLGISAVALLAIFAVVIWLMTSQPNKVTITNGPQGGVPVIKGFAQTNEAQAPTKGAFAPDFIWEEGGQNVALSSFRGDKPVFVNFWGTWCPPCRAEMPAMEQFYQLHKDEIQMIGVSMYPRDDPTTVLNFVKAANPSYSWKFVHDGDYKIAEKYQVASVPSSFFIDRNGIIKVVQVGAMMDEKMIENNYQQVK